MNQCGPRPARAATRKNPKWQKRAEEILLSLIQENPKLPDAHLELGVLYKRAGLGARATAQFRKVLRLRPDDPLARGRAGRVIPWP